MHLSDGFINILAYVSYFLKSVEARQPDYDQVRTDIQRFMLDSEALLIQGTLSRDDYEQARFAICAWVDEAFLKSPWKNKNHWLKDQLQRRYYNTTDAGEEFFDRLSSLGLHQREVREVYYLCLALGFNGRYCHPGEEYQLEQIKTSTLKLLLGSSVGLPSLERTDLFPEAYPAVSVASGGKRMRGGGRLASAICLTGPVFLFCLLYLIYRFTLNGVGENFLRTVTN
ncbi:MAG: DotU family type IV/VI secretion system protein [Geobacteraceae bacterium]|nr:DotU family type IV/VI secretion system protein [Geobacteraceae bacterium]